jgi:hypothetical protein
MADEIIVDYDCNVYYVLKYGEVYVSDIVVHRDNNVEQLGYRDNSCFWTNPHYSENRRDALKSWNKMDMVQLQELLEWNTVGAPEFRVVKVNKKR